MFVLFCVFCFISVYSTSFLCILLHFCVFYFISVYSTSFLCILLHFCVFYFTSVYSTSFLCILLHFYVFWFISVYSDSFLCILIHFCVFCFISVYSDSFLCILIHFCVFCFISVYSASFLCIPSHSCVYCFIVLFCVLFVCKCVLYCCHQVATQLQSTNISISNTVVCCNFLQFTADINCTRSCDSSYSVHSVREIDSRRVWKPTSTNRSICDLILMDFWCVITSNLVACSESVICCEDGNVVHLSCWKRVYRTAWFHDLRFCWQSCWRCKVCHMWHSVIGGVALSVRKDRKYIRRQGQVIQEVTGSHFRGV
jgi:hypothetical protein